jgi:hypothetical protein
MWLARLFGGRKDDSEPSEFPPHPASNAPMSARVANRPSASHSQPQPPQTAAQKAKGFDPYNSGAFRKSSAWERVSRR